MMRLCVVLLVIAGSLGRVAAQDLPPEVLVDQYLLEAASALEEGDNPSALEAFRRIEALPCRTAYGVSLFIWEISG